MELEAIQEVLNSTSNKNNHINTLLEPTLAIVDPDLIRDLALQRNVQIIATETMNSVLREKMHNKPRPRKNLSNQVLRLGVLPQEQRKGNSTIFKEREDLKYPCLVDVCL